MLRNFGRSSLHEFLGDRVIYRSLNPADPNLPRLAELADALDLQAAYTPRKSEPDYGLVVARLLGYAQLQRGIALPLQRLLYIGDTHLLDATAFSNLCIAGKWSGLAFIGSEDLQPIAVEVEHHHAGGALYRANRWGALVDFTAYLAETGFIVDETTAVVIDLDKTALGARGRNGGVIDQARLQAVFDTAGSMMGEDFDRQSFRHAYDLLNQVEYHSFTADNQDYLVYICLVLNSGFKQLELLQEEVQTRQLTSFRQFIEQVEKRVKTLPNRLQEVHGEIFSNVQTGDPTPFKAFRRQEYLRTIACFRSLPDSSPLEQMLTQEILITNEVRQASLCWLNQGALLFGLSDKPDEAAKPTAELKNAGYPDIHRAQTHRVGDDN